MSEPSLHPLDRYQLDNRPVDAVEPAVKIERQRLVDLAKLLQGALNVVKAQLNK